MTYFALEPDFATEVISPADFVESVSLWRSFTGRSLKAAWVPPQVTVQKRSRRGNYLSFIRNAPCLTKRGAELVSDFAGNAVEFLPLKGGAEQLFVLNTLEVLADDPAATSPPVFRLSGHERDAIFGSDGFRAHCQAAGLEARFSSPSTRFPLRAAEEWGLPTSQRLRGPTVGATAERIALAEARCGLQFPDSLRWLFQHANGAELEDDSSGLRQFNELRDGHGSAEWVHALLVVDRGLVPWTFFPFGDDSGGNIFFVDCASREGRVFLYLHDTAFESLLPFKERLPDLIASLTQ